MGHLAYKFRLYPNATQERELRSQLETLRQVYNTALSYWRDLYQEEKRSPKRNEANKAICTIRNLQIADQKAGGEGPHWLTRVSAGAVRDTCARVKSAFDHFFRRAKAKKEKAGFPRFKSYGRLTSIPCDCYGSGCSLRGKDGKSLKADVPAQRRGYRLDVFGAGRSKCIAHRGVAGTIKTACVEREPDGKWYVILTAKTPDEKVEPKEGPAVGIDVGLEHFLTDSDGGHRPNPKYLKSHLKELRRLQRSASRKSVKAKAQKRKFRECKNLQKSFREVSRLHVRVRNLRKEHHHVEANLIVRKAGTVCVESLNVRGMVRNGKLSRAISDAGWSGFLSVLKHKAARAGVRFVEVDARGSSQTCPECWGAVSKDLKVRKHECPHCGYVAHRDHAAARVILARGVDPGGAGSVPAAPNLGDSRDVQRNLIQTGISQQEGPTAPRGAASRRRKKKV